MSNGDDFYVPQTNKGLFAYLSGWVIALIALFVLIGIVLAVGTYAFNWFAAPYQGKLQARQQIQGSGDFRIQAYNQFFDQCASIQTAEQNLKQFYSDLKTAKGDDRSRIQTNITANVVDVNGAINQYNADARKNYTVGQFRDASLPYSISPYQKGQVTSCGG